MYGIVLHYSSGFKAGGSNPPPYSIYLYNFLIMTKKKTDTKKKTVTSGKKQRKKQLTPKQKKLVELLSGDTTWKSLGKILLEAWYSEESAKHPGDMLAGKWIQEALRDRWINEDLLAQKQMEHIDARKIEFKNYWLYTIPTEKEKIEALKKEFQDDLDKNFIWARFISMKQKTETKWQSEIPYIEVKYSIPEYSVQRDTVKDLNKIFWNYAPDKVQHSGGISLLALFQKDKPWQH